MGTLSLFLPLSSVLLCPPSFKRSSPRTHLPIPISWRRTSSNSSKSTVLGCRTVVSGVNPREPNNGSEFLDENGVVEDMDGYLNYLSLEYDSVWDTKPSWCQPWTITLTGALVIACSWLILHSVVVTTIVASLIFAWWYIFLYSYPKEYADMIAERRKKVTNGSEDTFGWKKSQ